MGGCIGRNSRPLFSIPEGDIEGINEASVQESCRSESDVLSSETTARILKVVGKQVNRGKRGDEQTDIDRIIGLYESVFEKGMPITLEERADLNMFFLNSEAFLAGNQILSRLSIQQTNENKEFIRGFLEDQNGKYDNRKFIYYVLRALENYPFIVDIDVQKGSRINFHYFIKGAGKFYSYVNTSGKCKLFLIKENKEIIYFEEEFEQGPKIMENGLVFGVELRGKLANDKWVRIETIVDENEAGGEYSQVGMLYRFNGETSELEEIYQKEGITAIDDLDEEYDFFRTVHSNGKSGVLKVTQTDTDEWRVSEILQELYDRIYMGLDGFIVTEREEEEMQEDSTIAHNTIIGIHTEAWDDSAFPKDELIGKTLLGAITTESTSCAGKIDLVRFYEGTNICRVTVMRGDNYYTFDKEKRTITPIIGLQGVRKVGRDFFKGIPGLVEEGLTLSLKVFDPETATVRDLLEIQSKTYPTIDTRGSLVHLEFYQIGGKRYWLHEGKFYGLRKGFMDIGGNIYKDRLFWTVKDVGVSVYDDFDTMKEYLEEVSTRTILVMK